MGPRIITALTLVSLAAACTSTPSGSPATTAPAAETSTTALPLIAYDNSSSEVLVQIGDYEFGNNLDQFVLGPRLVIYGDGSAFAEVLGDGARNGAPVTRLIESRLSDTEIQSLLREASSFPNVASVRNVPADVLPMLLTVNGQSWDILDFEVEPFKSYIESVTATVTDDEVGAWVPAAWIQRVPPASRCLSVADPDSAPYFSAPVYPHLINTYPLGPFNC